MVAPARCLLSGRPPKSRLTAFEEHLAGQDWQRAAPEVEVKLCPADGDLHVLCRSQGRVHKEQAMRRRALKALVGGLVKLRARMARGRLGDPGTIERRIAHLEERHRPFRRFLASCRCEGGRLRWQWDRAKWRAAVNRDGACLLRARWPGGLADPAQLWRTYVQLTEAEAAFRTMKSELKVRPVRHQLDTRDGRTLTLPRITIPEKEQAALLLQLGWTLPEQPPTRIRSTQLPDQN